MVRKNLHCFEETIGRTMADKSASDDLSDGNEEPVSGNWDEGVGRDQGSLSQSSKALG